MMKYTRIIQRSAFLFIFVMNLMLSPSIFALPAEEKASVEDLFSFYLEEFSNKVALSREDASQCVGNNLLFGFLEKSNLRDTLRNFTNHIISEENTFKHLPEYWELRSIIDRDDDFAWIDKCNNYQLIGLFSNDLMHPDYNPVYLKKASEIDSSNGAAIWFGGYSELRHEYPNYSDLRDDKKKAHEYYSRLASINADAGKAEPDNAFYPIYEAAYNFNADKKDNLIESLQKASHCEYFAFPRLFPSSYVVDRTIEYENGTDPFDILKPGGSFSVFNNFFGGLDKLPNLIIVRNLFRHLVTESQSQDDWEETLNILHKVACKMGLGEGNEIINTLVAGTLVKMCLAESLDRAEKTSDIPLQMALVTAIEKVNLIKLISRATRADDKITYTFPYNIITDEYIRKFDYQNVTVTQYISPILESRLKLQIHEEQIKPVFIQLQAFDYADPEKWNREWKEKNFPAPKEKKNMEK